MYPGYEDILQNIYIDIGTRIALFIAALPLIKRINRLNMMRKLKNFINNK